MIKWVAAGAVGYVLGAKAGRRRYEQINKAYHAVVESPATRRALLAGRKMIAQKLDPQHGFKQIKAVDAETTVMLPKDRYGE